MPPAARQNIKCRAGDTRTGQGLGWALIGYHELPSGKGPRARPSTVGERPPSGADSSTSAGRLSDKDSGMMCRMPSRIGVDGWGLWDGVSCQTPGCRRGTAGS
jgi:hypothetical protein